MQLQNYAEEAAAYEIHSAHLLNIHQYLPGVLIMLIYTIYDNPGIKLVDEVNWSQAGLRYVGIQ